jgi:hypothetical protein
MLPVLPLSWAVNWVVSPERIVMLEGVTVMPSDFEFGPATANPPPQPDHTSMASPSTIALADFAPEDFDVPIISDPLS